MFVYCYGLVFFSISNNAWFYYFVCCTKPVKIWTKESTSERHPGWLVETHLAIVSEFRAIILKSFWSVRVKTTSNQEKYYYWKAPNLVPNSGTRRRLSTMETSIFNSSAPRVRAAASRFLLRATYSFNAYQNTMFTGVIFICNYYMRLKRFTLPEENWKCSAAAAAARAAGGLCEGAQVQHHCSVLWLSLGQKYWFYLFFTLNFSRRYFVTQRRGSRPFASLGRMPEGWFENWFCFFKCCTYVVPRVRWTAWDMPMMDRKPETWFVVAYGVARKLVMYNATA